MMRMVPSSSALRSICVLAACAAALLPAEAHGNSPALSPQERRDVATEGLKAYEEGLAGRERDTTRARAKMSEAGRRAQQLIRDGVDTGEIRLLEGNAALLSGDPGRAVAAYRSGLVSGGARAALRTNVRLAREQVRTPVEPGAFRDLVIGWRDWALSFPVSVWYLCFAASWVTLWLIVAAPRSSADVRSGARRSARIVVRAACAASIVCAALSAAVLGTMFVDAELGPRGVLSGEAIDARQGAGPAFDPLFDQPLSGGVEVRVRGGRPGWTMVQFPDGARGWVPDDAVVPIEGLPFARR